MARVICDQPRVRSVAQARVSCDQSRVRSVAPGSSDLWSVECAISCPRLEWSVISRMWDQFPQARVICDQSNVRSVAQARVICDQSNVRSVAPGSSELWSVECAISCPGSSDLWAVECEISHPRLEWAVISRECYQSPQAQVVGQHSDGCLDQHLSWFISSETISVCECQQGCCTTLTKVYSGHLTWYSNVDIW